MLGQRPSDAYRRYQTRTTRATRRPPPQRSRHLGERLIMGVIAVAALFVLLLGFWAITSRQPRQAAVAPTATVGERPRGALRLVVRNEAGQPIPNALVEFRDKFEQVVVSDHTDPGGQATAFVPVGSDYSITVRIPGYEVGVVRNLLVTEQAGPRVAVTLERAQGADAVPVPTAPASRPLETREQKRDTATGVAPSPAAQSSPRPQSSDRDERPAGSARVAGGPAFIEPDDRPAAEQTTSVPLRLTRPLLVVAHPAAQLTAIDPASNLRLHTTKPLGWRQFPLLAASPDGRWLWAGRRGSNQLLALDPTNLTVADTIDLGEAVSMTALAAGSAADRLWVAGVVAANRQFSSQLLEVSAASRSVERRYSVPAAVNNILLRPEAQMLYLLHRAARRLSLMRTQDGRIVASTTPFRDWLFDTERIPEDLNSLSRWRRWPTALAAAPDRAELYVVSPVSNHLLVLDAESGQPKSTIEVGQGGVTVLAHPDGQHLYVTNQSLGLVQVVDLSRRQVSDAIPVGQVPWAMVLNSDASRLYVGDRGSNTISVIDLAARRVTDTIAVPARPLSLVLVP